MTPIDLSGVLSLTCIRSYDKAGKSGYCSHEASRQFSGEEHSIDSTQRLLRAVLLLNETFVRARSDSAVLLDALFAARHLPTLQQEVHTLLSELSLVGVRSTPHHRKRTPQSRGNDNVGEYRKTGQSGHDHRLDLVRSGDFDEYLWSGGTLSRCEVQADGRRTFGPTPTQRGGTWRRSPPAFPMWDLPSTSDTRPPRVLQH